MNRSRQNSEKQESRCAAGSCHQLQSRSSAHANSGEPPAQLYSMGTGTTENVTVKGKNSNVTFEQCRYNFVEYKSGEGKKYGSGTSSPASWAGWVKNKKGGRNATQLHVVNARWGGPGGKGDKNIVPGSPAENSHHLHEAEKKFDAVAFNNTSTAVQDAKYECWATPKYGTDVDLKGAGLDHKDFGDPTLKVRITTSAGATDYPVTDGSEGLTIEDGS